MDDWAVAFCWASDEPEMAWLGSALAVDVPAFFSHRVKMDLEGFKSGIVMRFWQEAHRLCNLSRRIAANNTKN